ncbi:unnamed protein product, partial [Ectocarpus sp. 12 AP-2014]
MCPVQATQQQEDMISSRHRDCTSTTYTNQEEGFYPTGAGSHRHPDTRRPYGKPAVSGPIPKGLGGQHNSVGTNVDSC